MTEPFMFDMRHGIQEEFTLEAAVYQAIGAASMCWDNPSGAGVFDSERAIEIAEALLRLTRGNVKRG